MERELWSLLCHLLKQLVSGFPRGLYGEDEVLSVYFWAVVHDRPVSWSCDRRNWPSDLCPAHLPSQPTMSKRLRTARVESLLLVVERHLLGLTAVGGMWVRVIDAKALPVGGPSKDRDAAWGRGSGGINHGYKFYAIWGEGPLPVAWGVAPLNVSERRMAKSLIADLPGEGYLLGDKHYDSNALYDAAGKAGYQLVAARQNPGKGLGHQRHSPFRLRAIELLDRPFGKALYRLRIHIEHCFAHLTSFAGGLEPLPFWVRRFHRVRTWIHAKLLINAVRIMRHTLLAIE
jgi:hypothetical protein